MLREELLDSIHTRRGFECDDQGVADQFEVLGDERALKDLLKNGCLWYNEHKVEPDKAPSLLQELL